jgi:hypothetical protein
MGWEVSQLIAVGIFAMLTGAALGLLRPREDAGVTVRTMRTLALGLLALFAIELGVRLGSGSEPWTAFVCSAYPRAALHAEEC